MKADDAKSLKELENENQRLKKLLADEELDNAMLKELAGETSDPGLPPRAVSVLREQFGVSERRACRVVGQPRSTQRLNPRSPPTTN